MLDVQTSALLLQIKDKPSLFVQISLKRLIKTQAAAATDAIFGESVHKRFTNQ